MKAPLMSTWPLDEAFKLELNLRYSEVDRHLKATPAALLAALQEAAIMHSEEVGRGVEWLTKRYLSWMLVQTRVAFLRWPAWRSRLEVITWPSEMGRMMSRREFVLCNGSRDPLLVGTTLWAFMDTSARKVCRLPPEISQAYEVSSTRALDRPFCRPEPCQKAEWENQFAVGRRQIDFNGHVNNLCYLDWMLETMPTNLDEWILGELNIRYEKEIGFGDTVLTQSASLPPAAENTSCFAHQIRSGDSAQSIACADTKWLRYDGNERS